MPKRSAQEKIEHYQRKIKRLEKKQSEITENVNNKDNQTAPPIAPPKALPVAPPMTSPVAPQTADPVPQAPTTPPSNECTGPDPEGQPSDHDQEEGAPATDDTELQEPNATPGTSTEGPEQTEPELDPEILQALGESTDDSPEYGDKILEKLANLWLPLLKKGMPKETKDKVLKEYLIPDNCRLLQAPKLNPEISAAVPDMVRNRDKNLVTYQQQLGLGITAISKATELLLKGDNKVEAVRHLSNGCRILCDLHSSSTQSRIKLITPSLDKSFLHVIQDSERDETIFGTQLSEKIKAAKAIEKQGLQIKKPTNPKVSAPVQSTVSRVSSSGNWSAPPRYPSYRGGRGGSKKSNQHNNRRPQTAPSGKSSGPPNKSRAQAPQ